MRRSSGKSDEDVVVEVGGRRWEVEGRKMALRAAAAVEEVGGLRVEEVVEVLFGSRTARRSQRHEGQKPVKTSCG